MTSAGAIQRKPIKNTIGIGQVWRHHSPEFSIRIKQVHRADALVEAWFDGPGGSACRGVTFADLAREYELIG
jgi:hypothetical protein